MNSKRRTRDFWNNKENCIESSKNYKTIKDWIKNVPGAYGAAQKNGWLEDCKKHMIFKTKPSGYWIKENCKKSALKFRTKSEWYKNESSAYNSACKNGWLAECCLHMKDLNPAA